MHSEPNPDGLFDSVPTSLISSQQETTTSVYTRGDGDTGAAEATKAVVVGGIASSGDMSRPRPGGPYPGGAA
jgi:hypothetical protein